MEGLKIQVHPCSVKNLNTLFLSKLEGIFNSACSYKVGSSIGAYLLHRTTNGNKVSHSVYEADCVHTLYNFNVDHSDA